MDYPELNKLNPSNCTERSIEKHYHEFWEYIIGNYHCVNWTERLYWFYNDLKDYPKCPVCGKPTKFINLKTGYREFCSTKCMNSSKSIQERKKQTSLKNWGTENPMQSKQVCEKLKNAVREKYGVDNIFQSSDFKEKRIKTNLEKYGVEHHLQNEDVKSKLIKTIQTKNIIKDDNLISYNENGEQIRKCPHKNCNQCKKKYYITPTNIYFDRQRLGYETCTNLLPIGNSQKSSLEFKIRQLLDKYNIEYITNNRKLTGDGKELDIYIPSKRLAIECNGIWSHSIMNNLNNKPKNYHIDKTKNCNKHGIELIHLWEDWILFKWDIVESMILNKLGLISNTVYARNCHIEEIDPKICNDFLETNHIQGRDKSGYHVKYGLYYNDSLVSVMTFKLNDDKWVLSRFASLVKTRVLGGASKLLKHFIKNYNPEQIISYSSNDISNGNLYKTLGFESDYKIANAYWYFTPGNLYRYHRSSYSKHEIVKRGWRDKVDNSWTEQEVMEEYGFFCIYDSGQLKWVLKLE